MELETYMDRLAGVEIFCYGKQLASGESPEEKNGLGNCGPWLLSPLFQEAPPCAPHSRIWPQDRGYWRHLMSPNRSPSVDSRVEEGRKRIWRSKRGHIRRIRGSVPLQTPCPSPRQHRTTKILAKWIQQHIKWSIHHLIKYIVMVFIITFLTSSQFCYL